MNAVFQSKMPLRLKWRIFDRCVLFYLLRRIYLWMRSLYNTENVLKEVWIALFYVELRRNIESGILGITRIVNMVEKIKDCKMPMIGWVVWTKGGQIKCQRECKMWKGGQHGKWIDEIGKICGVRCMTVAQTQRWVEVCWRSKE